MAIKTLPSRYPELGRVRLGDKGPKGEPRKGKFLRFSSNDRAVLDALAAELGGTVKPWDDDKAEQAFHLTTKSGSVPVLLPPEPIDTSYERWGSGGIARRCDGERCLMPVQGPDGGHMVEQDCACIAEGLVPGDRADTKNGACQVTVRLRLVIPSVPGIGAWLCTSHSVYAAMELPGQVELLQAMAGRGRLVPAEFAIDHRTEKKPWEKYKRDYIVPVLRIRASIAELASGSPLGVGAAAPALPATARPIDCPEACDYTGPDKANVAEHLISWHDWQLTPEGKVAPPKAPGAGSELPSTRSDSDGTAVPSPQSPGAGPSSDAGLAAPPGGDGEPAPDAASTGVAIRSSQGSPPGVGPSLNQFRAIHGALRRLGVSEDDKHRYVCDLIGIPVVSTLNELTRDEASRAIEALKVEEGVKA